MKVSKNLLVTLSIVAFAFLVKSEMKEADHLGKLGPYFEKKVSKNPKLGESKMNVL